MNPNKLFIKTANTLKDLSEIKDILSTKDHGFSLLKNDKHSLEKQMGHLKEYRQDIKYTGL